MGVLLPNYLEENVVKGKKVPNFKFNTSTGTTTGTSSNVFQILQDLRLKQCQGKCHSDSMQSDSKTCHSTTNTFTQQNMAQPTTSFRTTTPSTATSGRRTTKQVNPVQVP